MAESFDPTPPTMRLPPIKLIPTTNASELRSCVKYLRFLYNPDVRGSRRRKASVVREENRDRDNDRLKALRTDAFERSHAIRWLTSLVARGEELPISDSVSQGNGCDDVLLGPLIDDAAALLAACAGTAGSGHIVRTYTFGPSPAQEEVMLVLADAPLENGDYASVGAQTWGGACVLAEMLLDNPEQFKLPIGRNRVDITGRTFRVLELGAGTGLLGLACAKLLELRNVTADVVLTDVHLSVLANLHANSTANFPPSGVSCVNLSVLPLNWASYASNTTFEDNTLGTFDLIIGADIVYETDHAVWIKACLSKLLRPGALFHLVIPLRQTHTAESSTVEQVFGLIPSPDNFEITYKERFFCDAHDDAYSRLSDRADEVEYAYYRIGWKPTHGHST